MLPADKALYHPPHGQWTENQEVPLVLFAADSREILGLIFIPSKAHDPHTTSVAGNKPRD